MDAVLVLDGDPATLDATCKMLQAEGYLTCRATSLIHVQEQLTGVRFPVCLIDPRIATSVTDLTAWARQNGLDTEFVIKPSGPAALSCAVSAAANAARNRQHAVRQAEELQAELMMVMGRASLLRQQLGNHPETSEQAALLLDTIVSCFRLVEPTLDAARA